MALASRQAPAGAVPAGCSVMGTAHRCRPAILLVFYRLRAKLRRNLWREVAVSVPALDFVVGPSRLLAAGGFAPRLRLRRTGTRYSAR